MLALCIYDKACRVRDCHVVLRNPGGCCEVPSRLSAFPFLPLEQVVGVPNKKGTDYRFGDFERNWEIIRNVGSVIRMTFVSCIIWLPVRDMLLAHQNRTITIASDFRVDGAKSPEILQKEGVSGSEIAARNRKSLATFHRTLKSQCGIAFFCLGNRNDFWGPRWASQSRAHTKGVMQPHAS